MKASDVMAEDVRALAPDETIQSAAQMMAELGVGALPVGTSEDIQGILTDRDILIRVVAMGLDCAATAVRDVMSSDVVTCTADTPLERIRQQMTERQIRRMPVLDADRRLIGLVTLPDPGEGDAVPRAADARAP